MFPGKRRWQKLKDPDCLKRLREEIFADKTHLLRSHDAASGNPDQVSDNGCYILASGRDGEVSDHGCYVLASVRDGEEIREAQESVAHLHKSYILGSGTDSEEVRNDQKSEPLSQSQASYTDKHLSATRLSTEDRLSKNPVAVDRTPVASSNSASCSSSCRSFKKLLSKPFMPLSSRKGTPDELQRLRPQEIEWVSDNSNENSNILMSRTNVLELGKMDVNMQDSINTSALLGKSKLKEDLQPSQTQNLKIVAANKGKSRSGLSIVSMKVQAQFKQKANKENLEQHTNPPKENVILKKLLQRSKKGQALLLEDGGFW